MAEDKTIATIVMPNGTVLRAVGGDGDAMGVEHLDVISHRVRDAVAKGEPLVLGGGWRVEPAAPYFAHREELNGAAVEFRAPTIEGLQQTVAAFTRWKRFEPADTPAVVEGRA